MEELSDPFEINKNKLDGDLDGSQSIVSRTSKRVSFASSNHIKEFTDTSAIMYEVEASIGSDTTSSANTQSPNSDMELTGSLNSDEFHTSDSTKILQPKVEPVYDEINLVFNQNVHPIPSNVSQYVVEPMNCSPIKTFLRKSECMELKRNLSYLTKSGFSIVANEPEDMDISPCESFSTVIQSSNHCADPSKIKNIGKIFLKTDTVEIDDLTEEKSDDKKQHHSKDKLTVEINPSQKLKSLQIPNNYSTLNEDMELAKPINLSGWNQSTKMPIKLHEDMESTKPLSPVNKYCLKLNDVVNEDMSRLNQSSKTPTNCTSRDMKLKRVLSTLPNESELSESKRTKTEDKENVVSQTNDMESLTFAALHLSAENISKETNEILELSDCNVHLDNEGDTNVSKINDMLKNSRKFHEYFLEQIQKLNENRKVLEDCFMQIKAKDDYVSKESSKELTKPYPSFKFLESKFNIDEEMKETSSDLNASSDNLKKIQKSATTLFDSNLEMSLEISSIIEDKIKERSKRKKNLVKIVSLESPIYKFSTLRDAISFYAVVDNSGAVQDFSFNSKISDENKEIAIYVNKILMERFSHRNMQSALGRKFDIFAFLDYVELNVGEGLTMCRQFSELRRKGISMDKEFQLIYKVVNLFLRISWEISINGKELNNITSDSVSVMTKIGMTREKEIKQLAENCPTGFSFLTCFVLKIEAFVEDLEKKKKNKVR